MPRTVGVAVLCSLPESMPQSSLALLWASPDGESGDKGCGGQPLCYPGPAVGHPGEPQRRVSAAEQVECRPCGVAQLSGWLLPSPGPREGQANHSCDASLGLPPGGPCAPSVLSGNCGSHRAIGWMGPGQPEASLPLPLVLRQPWTRVPRHPQEPVNPASSCPDQISLPPAAPGSPCPISSRGSPCASPREPTSPGPAHSAAGSAHCPRRGALPSRPRSPAPRPGFAARPSNLSRHIFYLVLCGFSSRARGTGFSPASAHLTASGVPPDRC